VSQPEPTSDPATTAANPAPAAYPQAIHLRPTAPLAERVLLPGDPGRALALAQTLLEKPLMFNHHRGLWGYTGPAVTDGAPLTIQSTGMGGPSAAIVLTELIALGARRLIRVGTCGALVPDLSLGDLVVARESICADGTSRALGAGDRVAADPALAEALLQAGQTQADSTTRRVHSGTVISVDLFYDSRSSRHPPDALAIEMEAASLLAVGAAASVPVACALVVSDTFERNEPHPPTRTRIDDDSLLAAGEAMGAVAVAALPA
jgi:DeoD family purine-nucleoside phosphorylase